MATSKAIRLLERVYQVAEKRKTLQNELEFISSRTENTIARLVLTSDDEIALVVFPTNKDGQAVLSMDTLREMTKWVGEMVRPSSSTKKPSNRKNKE